MQFFKPGPASSEKRRPLLVSAGLERRDYKILADASGDLDLDVAVTGFSTDVAAVTSSFSDKWPSNFCRRRYEWLKLARLYQDADAVVVTLFPVSTNGTDLMLCFKECFGLIVVRKML